MMEQPQKAKLTQIQSQRFRFNTSPHNLQCFISKHPKSRSNNKEKQKTNTTSKPLIKVLQQQSACRTFNSPYFDFCFDHKVLFTHYGSEEVYVDTELNHADQLSNNNQIECQDLKSEEVVSQCLRAISQDTNDNSSTSFSSGNPLKFNNEQSYDVYRSKPRQNGQQIVFSIKPYESEFDGRTTLMLRNIPNKYTQEMVLQQVQAAGLQQKYDFFYLPIDFKNDCNVGYAFINLTDVKHVRKIYEKFHGKKWPRFNSQKICQVCYARIQGTPQLLSHFRFSNTLQRDNRYRPLIYVNLNLMNTKIGQSPAKNDKNYSADTI